MRPDRPKQLTKLREQMVSLYAKLVQNGWKFTAYRCNHCRHLIPEKCPTKPGQTGSKGYWDSMTQCVSCGRLNFVFVWPSGRTVSRKFPPIEGEKVEDSEYRHVPVPFALISKITLK